MRYRISSQTSNNNNNNGQNHHRDINSQTTSQASIARNPTGVVQQVQSWCQRGWRRLRAEALRRTAATGPAAANPPPGPQQTPPTTTNSRELNAIEVQGEDSSSSNDRTEADGGIRPQRLGRGKPPNQSQTRAPTNWITSSRRYLAKAIQGTSRITKAGIPPLSICVVVY
ncbi:uncharacterized protein Dwil_GK27980 [Drosophila willistoni]|uniref:Uncharacterized protein n=1 Tax=Drosophila willistoni TaxID=7260 RepID=A0A0Q9WNR9_DROWI|nr:uncharacterized protein Dwil_GK27980 [Drosophila willistoni]